MKHLSFLLFLMMAVVFTSQADNTLRGNKLRVANPDLLKSSSGLLKASKSDTIFSPSPESITLSGYDKPLNSMKESMLVTNNTEHSIITLRIEIVYMDLSGRELHSSIVDINTSIPGGRTRKVIFPSWDTQKSYYYHLGKKPRTNNVTPYSVKCNIIYYTTNTDTL